MLSIFGSISLEITCTKYNFGFKCSKIVDFFVVFKNVSLCKIPKVNCRFEDCGHNTHDHGLRWGMLCWWCLRSFKLTLSRSKKDLAWNHAMIFNNPLSSLTTMDWNEFRRCILFLSQFCLYDIIMKHSNSKVKKLFYLMLFVFQSNFCQLIQKWLMFYLPHNQLRALDGVFLTRIGPNNYLYKYSRTQIYRNWNKNSFQTIVRALTLTEQQHNIASLCKYRLT